MRLLAGLLAVLALSTRVDAVVRFTDAWLYDEIDLSYERTPLNCDDGCYVYASLPEKSSAFEENVCVEVNGATCLYYLNSFARQYDSATGAKLPIRLPAGKKYALVNRVKTNPTNSVVVYVISKKLIESKGGNLPRIYEPLHTAKGSTFLNTSSLTDEMVTFLSAEPFTLKALNLDRGSYISITMSGPDIYLNDDNLQCMLIYYTYARDHNTLPVRSPIATIQSDDPALLNWEVATGIDPATTEIRNGMMTIVTSNGFIGMRPTMDVFRWKSIPASVDVTYKTVSNDPIYIGLYALVSIKAPVYLTSDRENRTIDITNSGLVWWQSGLDARYIEYAFQSTAPTDSWGLTMTVDSE